MKIFIPLFTAAFSISAYAQTDLPDRGSMADIKGKTKIFIVADAQNTKQILKGQKDYVSSQ